jgi:hypothetical protein
MFYLQGAAYLFERIPGVVDKNLRKDLHFVQICGALKVYNPTHENSCGH